MNLARILCNHGLTGKKQLEAISRFLKRKHVIFLDSYKIKVGNFLCADGNLEADITHCLDNLKSYRQRVEQSSAEQRGRTPPYNVLLASYSGAGKSFLAESLAIAVSGSKGKQYFEQFNLTWMENTQDLEDMFVDIQQLSGKSLRTKRLHFFLLDECDSFFTFPVFQRLSMPIWDGKFFKSGVEKQLPPCVLIFAVSILRHEGVIRRRWRRISTLWSQREVRDIWRQDKKADLRKYFAKLPKGLDFWSRIHDVLLIPSLTDDVGSDADNDVTGDQEWSGLLPRNRDKILLLVVFIRKYFEKVNRVQKAALYLLATLKDKRLSVRKLENTIFKCSPPKDHQFMESNLPTEIRRKSQRVTDAGNVFGSSDFIHIYDEFNDFVKDSGSIYREAENDCFKQAFGLLSEQLKLQVIRGVIPFHTENQQLGSWLEKEHADLVEEAGITGVPAKTRKDTK